MKKTMFRVCVVLFFAAMCISVNAQDFFSSDELDTIAKPFYQCGNHVTVAVIGNPVSATVGASLLVHFNKEKLSSYCDLVVNTNRDKPLYSMTIQTVTSINGNDSLTLQFLDTSFKSKNVSVTFGLSSAITPRVLIYGNVGSRFQIHKFKNPPGSSVLYKNSFDDPFNLIYGAGVQYIFPIGLTFQAGLLFPDVALLAGVGFTL